MTKRDWIEKLVKAQNEERQTWRKLEELHRTIADCLTELQSIELRKPKIRTALNRQNYLKRRKEH